MVFHATLVTYIISLTINSVYLYFDIKGSKEKATLSDYFLILTPESFIKNITNGICKSIIIKIDIIDNTR